MFIVVSELFVRIGEVDAKVLVETSNCKLQHPKTKELDLSDDLSQAVLLAHLGPLKSLTLKEWCFFHGL